MLTSNNTPEVSKTIQAIVEQIHMMDDEISDIKRKEEELFTQREELVLQQEQFRNQLLLLMEANNIKTSKYDDYTVTVRPIPPAITILDSEAIPPQFRMLIPEQIIPATWKPNKKAIVESYRLTHTSPAGTEVIDERKVVMIKPAK